MPVLSVAERNVKLRMDQATGVELCAMMSAGRGNEKNFRLEKLEDEMLAKGASHVQDFFHHEGREVYFFVSFAMKNRT